MGEEIDDLPVLKKTSNGYEKIYSQGDDLPVIKKKLTESNETQSAPTNGVQEVSTSDSQTVVEPSLESGAKDSEVEAIPTTYDRLNPKSYSNLTDGTNYFTGSIRNGKPVVKKWNADAQEFQIQDDPNVLASAQKKFGKGEVASDLDAQKNIARKELIATSDKGDEIELPTTSAIAEKAGVSTYLNKDKIADDAALVFNRAKSVAQQPQVSTYMQMMDLYGQTDDPTAKEEIASKLDELKKQPFNFQETNTPIEGAKNPSLSPLMPSIDISKLKTVGEAVDYTLGQMDEGRALLSDYANTEKDLLKINEEYQQLNPQDPKGFWYNAIRAVKEHSESLSNANKIALGSDSDVMNELENNYIKAKIFPKLPTEGLGTAGELAGSVAGTIAPTIGVSMTATALTGNPIAGVIAGGVYTAQDMARAQYANGFQEMYNEMRDKNPNEPQNLVYETAKQYAKQTAGVQGAVGLAVGSFLPALRGESLLAQKTTSQIAKKFFTEIAADAGIDLAVSSTGQGLNNFIGQNLGSDRSIFDGVIETGGTEALMSLMVGLVTHGFPTASKIISAKNRQRAVDFLAASSPENIENVFGNAVQNGSSPLEVQELRREVLERMEAFKQMPPFLSAEDKLRLAPLYEQRQRLVSHLKDNPASESGVLPEIEKLDRKIAEEGAYPLTEKEQKEYIKLRDTLKEDGKLNSLERTKFDSFQKRIDGIKENKVAEKEAKKNQKEYEVGDVVELDPMIKPTPEKVEVKEEPVVEPPKAEVVETPAEETPAPKKKTQKEIKEENKVFKQEILVAEPMTPRQMIMQWFAGGGKLNTDDFKNETGFKNGEEFRKRIWAHTRNKYFMRDRRGMRVGEEVSPYSMDDLVMAIKNEWADGYGKELDEQDIRNEIIDVLQSHNTPSEIIENLRQDFSDKDGNIIGNRYDRADIRNQEAQEAMGVFEKADEHAENENVVEAIEKVDEVELSEKDISSIKEFLSKFTDENGEVDWAKAEESSQDVFNPEFGLLTDKASKQIEKIIADGKAKNDGRKQSENLSENTGDKGNNGGQDKAEGEGEKIIKQEYSQKLAEADAKIEAAKQAKETEVNAINKRANLFGGDTGAEKNKGLFGAQKDDYAQIEKIVAEHDRKIAESEGAKQKLLEQQDRDIANAVDVEKRQQKMELKEDVVGKEISFAHAGSDKTGTVNAVDKDGNYKVKIGGINYTVKPENVIKDAIKAEERIAIEKENDNLKNEIEGLIKKSSKKGDAKADAKKIVKLGVPGTQQLADLPNKIFQNLVADKVRKFEDKVARTLQRGAISQTNSLRHIADFISSFSRGIMDTREYSESHRKILKGGINRAKQDAEDLHGQLWNLIGGDINSADRIHQVLDPDLRQTGLAFADLTAQEQQLHDLLRGINNYTHNQNYLLGKISKETYDKYKDKYVGREYDYEKDYDQTVGGKSIREILGIYKQRGDVDADKLLHSIKDPIYLTLRRYMQTGQNKAVSEYADWIFRNNNELVSNTEREGFQFLGNGFGRLSNKYVARHVAEDFKGFVFNNTFMQLAYDVNKAYDGLAPRQFMKELLTVFNPQVQLGNYTSNMVFSWMGGVDLPTYLSKQPEAYRQIRDRGDVFRKLQSEGLLGTDFVSSDLVPMQDVLGAPATRNVFRKAESKARNLYSGVDDSAKIQMYLSLKDMGYSDAQAYQTIFESLQNYQNTGRIWDFASKTPVIGNSFVKFTPEMLRLLKNGMTRRPLHTMAFVGLMSAMPKLVGKYFGDDDEEIKAAGNQKGIPKIMIPYTDMSIPLSWRLGDKRVNVARFLMPIYMYDIGGENKVATDFANKFIPYQFKTTEEGGITPFNIQDPLVAPILSTIMNKDFRDKPIVEETDDNEGLFNEANFKRLRYIARGYGGFYANTIDDIFSANITGEDFYGRRKTATDIALNTLIKIETFDDARLKEGIVREFDGYERVTNKLYQEYTKKRKALQGDIDQIEADKLMGAERKKELIAKKEIRLTDVSENVLTDISDIQKQQLDATEFYKNLSRKQPYTDLTKEFQDSKKKIDQIEKRIDGKFKDSNTGGFNFGIKKPKFGG